MITPYSEIRTVAGISVDELERIKTFMKGAVYCWAKHLAERENPDERWFAVHDLVGGVNANWEATPLQVLYDRHERILKDTEKAFSAAGKEIGWLTKAVLHEDRRRTYETRKILPFREYRWVAGD